AAQPLTQEEVRALPFIMARVPLYWIAEACFLPDPVQKIIGQEEKIGDAAWLLEHRDEIVEMLV
ncbi:MAG: hypothetical protein J2P37_20400, partial [Ktedonobacteraceae bacterium]|nr:hypothetical protein [Ktedonobacteraceae bacterium]